jgi:cell division protein FtsI (penicillin-binding protein 3)
LTGSSLKRLVVLLVVFLLAFVGIVVQLFTLQVNQNAKLTKLGVDERVHTVAIPASRGDLLDRNGDPLALTLESRDIYVDPAQVTDPYGESSQLASALGLRRRDVEKALRSGGSFAYIARQVDMKTADDVQAMSLPGVGVLPSTKRYYPADALAPQVLGFVGIDGTGLAGLESEYDQELLGTPGESTAQLSPGGVPITGVADQITEPRPGLTLVTTIDREMQFQAQRYLARAVAANGAKAGTIVVMDPTTGDVLAMASYPWFNPNNFQSSSPDEWRNRAVTDTFEPGSVNKTITAAAAIDTGAVTPTETFRVPSHIQIGSYTIADAEPHPVRTMTLGDIVADSSNVGATMVADKLGSVQLASYLSRFGYGRLTGIGFPGEAPGVVPPLTDWTNLTRATVSYGQSVSVTPLQMAVVYATIANHGVWVQPRLIRGSLDDSGNFVASPASATRTVITPDTASMITRMLAYVVANGTGIEAQIPGYQVAGKTGTARKVDSQGRYVNKYMASFVGFLPASDPKVVIAVTIDQPKTVYGGVAAAPVFQEVARYAIQRLGIAPSDLLALPPHRLPLAP